jgi:enoyl-CoA hydratase/carnithine racemase
MNPSTPFTRVAVARDGGTEVITLFYPERRNAIGPVMTNELLHALDAAQADEAVRVVVLTGAGKAFCAGGDFAGLSGAADAPALPHKGDYADLLLALWRMDKPVIAKVNGHAMGGGLGLVAASTFAIASKDALLGTPEIDVGLFPMMIMAVLSRLVTRRRLVEMMLLGERMAADEAVKIGLLNAAVPSEALDEAVRSLAAKLSAKSPLTIRLGLRAAAAQEDLDLERALPMLRERLAECLATEDAREGLTAFLEKRPPVWKGK